MSSGAKESGGGSPAYHLPHPHAHPPQHAQYVGPYRLEKTLGKGQTGERAQEAGTRGGGGGQPRLRRGRRSATRRERRGRGLPGVGALATPGRGRLSLSDGDGNGEVA